MKRMVSLISVLTLLFFATRVDALTLSDKILLDDTKENTLEAAISKIESKGTPDFSTMSETKDGLFKIADDDGDSYYYRGQADNYVLYAGYLWRIIRINGDGSIRLLYSGTTENHTGPSTIINEGTNGKTYDNNGSVNYVNDDGSDSTIKEAIDDWYEQNILNKNDGDGNNYTSYLADARFCNDRSNDGGSPSTIFGAYSRITDSKKPSLMCSQKDILTVSNEKLKYPIATITADEAIFAGGTNDLNVFINGTILEGNSSYYLNSNQCYWSMSPALNYTWPSSGKELNYIFYISNNGYVGNVVAQGGCGGARPVINLKSGIFVSTGSGKEEDPYQVTLSEPKENPTEEKPKEDDKEEIVAENPDTGTKNPYVAFITCIASIIALVLLYTSRKKLNKNN